MSATVPASSTTAAAAPYPASRPSQTVLAECDTYVEAQALVDRLSDGGFPVEKVRIVGTGIHSVEQVTGRMTNGRAALMGAGSGAWFGLLIGLLFAVFAVGTGWLAVILSSLVIGAVWGALFGFVAHWATRGRHDFASVTALQAERYSVHVDATHFTDAARLTRTV